MSNASNKTIHPPSRSKLPCLRVAFIMLSTASLLSAQSYSRIALTAFTANSGMYAASTNIAIASNVLVTLKTVHFTPNVGGNDEYGHFWPYLGVKMEAQYSGGPWASPDQNDFSVTTYSSHPILGPCTLRFTATAKDNSNPAVYLLLQYDTVNVTPSPTGVVQPPNTAVTVSLQSSTNLSTWATATNGIYGGADNYRFFRVKLQ